MSGLQGHAEKKNLASPLYTRSLPNENQQVSSSDISTLTPIHADLVMFHGGWA